jgi:hypothetical protein
VAKYGLPVVRRARVALWAALLACGGEDEWPEGALARVDESTLTDEELEEIRAQLGAYAQARFRGPDGTRALLDALIEAELLAREAVEAGLGDDPRVEWAVVEELASLREAAELERRMPRASIAADVAALRAAYQDVLPELTRPERRSLEGVRFSELGPAERALADLTAGRVRLGDLGEVVRTPLASRDDQQFPGFHAILFDPGLREGDYLPAPVITERHVLVGRVAEIDPAVAPPFEDAAVQARLVEVVRARRAPEIRAEVLAELAERYPARGPLAP